jgi:LemA protein
MKNKGLIILVVVIAIIAMNAMGTYNGFVEKEENVNRAWSQVENVYQRRADLIPNLVSTVKGYAEHEKETFIAVTEARSKINNINVGGMMNDPAAFAKFQQAQGQLSSALSKLMVVVEKYPDLKANESFLNLQAQLEGTENRIAVARKRFNDSAKQYNQVVRKFPGRMWAGLFGFGTKNYFEAETGAEKAPKVEF